MSYDLTALNGIVFLSDLLSKFFSKSLKRAVKWGMFCLESNENVFIDVIFHTKIKYRLFQDVTISTISLINNRPLMVF